MAKQTSNQLPVRKRELAASLVALFLIAVGANGIYEQAVYIPNSSDWRINLGLVIFGSMILGVAINRMSSQLRGKGRK